MNYLEGSTWLTIGLILGTIIVSGPLVTTIDFASQPEKSTVDAGISEASISIVSPPTGEFRIAPGRYGSGQFLYVPSATVRVEAVRGDPILIYEVAITGLGFNAAELVFLSESDVGRNKTIEIDRPSVDQSRITEQTYQAAVSIRIRSQAESRILYSNNVTVVVEDGNDN